jgi:HD-GYP domain-containing protein (c-di-GMP phosphodiesterase class II)
MRFGIRKGFAMKHSFWRAISIDSIDPASFPKVALYVRRSGKYVLYKDPERVFSENDRRRLERSFTEFLYARSGDMEQINDYLENSLAAMLARDDLDTEAKGRMLYQITANYVIDVFDSPETASNLDRCRALVQYLMRYVAADAKALESIRSIMEHNYYILTHSVQVAALNLLLHEKLFNLDADEMLDVGIGSLLHDLGMIFVTNEILDKPDALSDVEYFKVKRHTQEGYEFLKNTGTYSDIALCIVRHHHERYDGNGYPAGLKGDSISRSAQLTALCDEYSALISDRSYRKLLSHAEALETMRVDVKKGAYNEELFKRFEEVINEINGCYTLCAANS